MINDQGANGARQPCQLIADPGRIAAFDGSWKPIEGIVGADVTLREGQPPAISLILQSGCIDVAGQPVFMVADPDTGKLRMVRKIVWGDGTTFEPPAAHENVDKGESPA